MIKTSYFGAEELKVQMRQFGVIFKHCMESLLIFSPESKSGFDINIIIYFSSRIFNENAAMKDF